MQVPSLTRQNLFADNFRKEVRNQRETRITIGDVGELERSLNAGILKLPRRRR
jgi:hypothetical protein